MSTHEARIQHLESKVEQHLEEAGEVREALVWLKRSHWVLTGAVVTSILAEVVSRLYR